MDPVIDNEWLGCKNETIDEMPNVGNIARSWQWRERGINPPHCPNNKTVLENMAEDILVQKPLQIRSCDLPGYPRSTFLMVFSPDGTKVASTHGNHNVYVSELASGKHVRILRGHPRTPWCIAFHPSHPLLIGSGCLGGQVRVWDIASGGSEVWNVRNETVIASIAFHPREQLLVIATYNELYFWDWSQPAPFTKVCTNNVNEKVRYVAFDALGYKLITGISLWACSGGPINNSTAAQNPPVGTTNNPNNNNPRRDDSDESPGTSRQQDSNGSAQDMIVNSYQNLVQRYDSLVRNYQRLFMVRHRLTNTPPPPNTTDRGTDPMETDVGVNSSGGSARPQRSYTAQNDAEPGPSTSRSQDPVESGDGENSRLLNLEVLSIDSNPQRNTTSSNQERSSFGSRSSAFQPLNSDRSHRSMEFESPRLLPNPFSSSNGTPRPTRVTFTEMPASSSTNTSRTSIFTSSRGSSLGRDFSLRRRNFTPVQHNETSQNDPATASGSPSSLPFVPRRTFQSSTLADSQPSTSGTSTQRPTMTNSSTQMSPQTAPVDAQTINESLDLIRDILRDSGTRLLNLITNMSLSTMAAVERNMPRRGAGARAHSDDGEAGAAARRARPRVRLFSSTWRREFLSSSSDSDSDQSSEVNIFRTRNTTFQEDEPRDHVNASTSSERLPHPTDRLVFELNDELRSGGSNRDPGPSREPGGINVSLSNNRFRVRTQSETSGTDVASSPAPAGSTSIGVGTSPPTESAATAAGTSSFTGATSAGQGGSTADAPGPSGQRTQSTPGFNPDRPSTSRDGFWNRGGVVPPDEAYRKVRSGVNALQKHTVQLTNLWLRGSRVTMRELRGMWETLRRRIITLHRETGTHAVPGYYTRPLLDRCMMLTDMAENFTRTTRNPRTTARNEDVDRNSGRNATANSNNANNTSTESERNTTTVTGTDGRPAHGGRSAQTRSSPSMRSSPSLRRRLQSNLRWRPEDELRRRCRNPTTAYRVAARFTNRSRRDFARAIEISATRHEIRMRAMQVLSIMFNMMMMCLEEPGLSQLIISMLRTLKRALALTCLLVMSNRNNGRPATNQAPAPQRVESLDVVRIQNVDHNVDVNVDGPDEQAPNNAQNVAQQEVTRLRQTDSNSTETPSTSASTTETVKTNNNNTNPQEPSTSNSTTRASQKWSDRLAVQIAAANRNNSATARNRRDLYMESRRLKALHRTNPTAHPLIRKRVLPPVSNYRIPALRSLPTRPGVTRFRSPRVDALNSNEPVAGPSNAPPPGENGNLQESPGSELMNEFEHRVNFIRIAHMQAVRLRNAARNRFRRLQTIRLYTPSSVREMFSLQANNGDTPPDNRSPGPSGSAEGGGRHPLAMFRPHILSSRADPGGRDDLSHQFHTVLNNVAMPLMHMSDLPGNDAPGTQRLPRIHEYLQPIILAQNAMVVEDEGGHGEGGGGGGGGGGPGARRLAGMAGMAGLFDAGIISEALPAPSHRVQAWDFTTGHTPEISDSTKNVVVQRCRIHNDASIDISKDGRLLVALLPVPRLRNTNHWLGVYSLEWARLGQCLHTAVLEQSAVSVALSPTARHLAVGLGSRRFTTAPNARSNVIALLYKLDPLESSSRTGLSPIKELEQNWEHGFTSLNCLRWAPQPGQGLVYANNTGQLIVMS
ncbi:uncharacterized protein LOC111362232 isoform X1 [Spodoptera litura]|uniref:Uncharacterized protein LOC111362232 isoform X1 n=1 Tax=Spodoptera litura TaxID=69820 RepID=A0A9J7IYZ0_SPOLT|nr:uncharacterized protein LOC111362232 isoform X1 [Spodoptera litura]XP_022834574.1 uncharacterized protein LOC111362232 isoform X1 [Spodoptera litura]XP_022834575.1 uncharacterized protein LOC111362232 isoform X1 [Spodoptera litura]XP_022834576.1 uncharacterized protein LOC111362232 isoform X1 [Spodoptera litura]